MRPRKNDGRIRELANKGLKGTEIARSLGLSLNTVYDSLKLSESDIQKASEFNKQLPSHLTNLIGKITRELSTRDLSSVSPAQLTTMLAIAVDKQRLLSGQSTSNQHVLFHIVGEACRTSPDKEQGRG